MEVWPRRGCGRTAGESRRVERIVHRLARAGNDWDVDGVPAWFNAAISTMLQRVGRWVKLTGFPKGGISASRDELIESRSFLIRSGEASLISFPGTAGNTRSTDRRRGRREEWSKRFIAMIRRPTRNGDYAKCVDESCNAPRWVHPP